MGKNSNWPRPQLNPLPDTVSNITLPRIDLNGNDWKLNLSPPHDFYDPAVDRTEWEDVVVPFQIDSGVNEYAYARMISIPAEWEGNRVFLRFDGANCLARVFVDGHFVRSHYGGFVSWDCDITEFITSGSSHQLVIGLTDKPQEINPFHQGGLIRDVTLYVKPDIHLSRLHVETVFDEQYEHATLTVSSRIEGGNGTIELLLTSPDGEDLELAPMIGEAERDLTMVNNIEQPLKWDSEHPYLYRLRAFLIVKGKCLEQISILIGFRQIEKRGSEVYVNNKLLKLRGINRHDIHPVSGRALSRKQLEEDVRLFKYANINFIRTSHYPPSPTFLELCDQYGIYVENEIAVSFLGYGTWHTESDPDYTSRYMDQFAELIERDRSHSCVIIWSLANESYWGDNIAQMNAYAKQEDPSRLTIFSYPLTQYEDDLPTDIWSIHYDRWDQNLAELTDCFRRSYHEPDQRPVLHDESTHIPCYNLEEHQRDPSVRDFWGETIYRYWDRLWETEGALGCAIWAGIDDIRLKDKQSYIFPWGIIDGWRRPKPEYWHTRKGFSPIKLRGQPKDIGGFIGIQIINRFNHTNLNEIRIDWKIRGKTEELQGPDVPPRGEGLLFIQTPYDSGETIELTFTDSFGYQVHEELLVLGERSLQLPQLIRSSAPEIQVDEEYVRIVAPCFTLVFSTRTGLITEGYDGDKLVLRGGPYLQLTGLALGPWVLDSIEAVEEDGIAKVTICGRYERVIVQFLLKIDVSGLMETTYTIVNIPYPSPREIAISGGITSHAGGYDEVGIAYNVSRELNSLSWNRKGLWNVYPEWHLARLTGKAGKRNPQGENSFDSKPEWDWMLDEKDRSVFGLYDIGRRGTRDFRSMKPSILQATLENNEGAFHALSDGSVAVRMKVELNPDNVVLDTNPAIRYSGTWKKRETRFRTLGGTESWSSTKNDYCEYTFKGTGIAWVSSLDQMCGIAKVYVDGHLKEIIDLGLSKAGKTARGYSRLYGQIVYSIEDLPHSKHTIRIEVVGENAEGSYNCHVCIDHFIILDGNEIGETRFIINNEFNYPKLSWGDYTKPPIQVSSGYTGTVFTKLG